MKYKENSEIYNRYSEIYNRYSEIYNRYSGFILLEGAAEDMITSVLDKLKAPHDIVQLFLSKDNGKLIFKPEHVGLLYSWIRDESGDSRTLIEDYKAYQKYFQNVPLNYFKSYLDWTEKVHAKRDEAEYLNRNKNLADINIEEQDKENVLANDEDVLILKGDDEHKCVRYGKGYSFCISRGGGGNMYGNYRLSKSSTFYFVFFKKIPKEDERHIMVLDRTQDGWEWTFGKNQTKVVHGGWNEIVRTFPALEKYENVFVNKPLTDEENKYQNKLKRFVGSPSLEKFEKFSIQEKDHALKFGMLIPLDLFQSLDKYLRNEWISVGPKMSDDIYELLNDKEKERFIIVRKQQLSQRNPEDKFDIEICRNDTELFEKHLKPDKTLCDREEKEIQRMIVNGICQNDIKITCKYFFPNLDNLIKSKNIYAYSAQTLSLPQLKESAYINASSAKTLSLPQLQKSGDINAYSAQTLSLPQLQKSGNIIAKSAQTLSLPQLKESGYINASSAQTLSLPQLKESGNINAYSAQTLSLPQLKESGDIYASSAQTLSLPQLKESGDIYAILAQKIIIHISMTGWLTELHQNVKIIDPSEYTEELNDSYIYDLMRNFLLRS